MLNLDRDSRLAYALAETLGTEQTETLGALREAALKASQAKAGKADALAAANKAAASLWPLVRDVAKAAETADGASELDAKTVGAVAAAVILDVLKGEEAAIKTVKSYTSTAKKAISAVRSGVVRSWLSLEVEMVADEVTGEMVEQPVSYEAAREAMRSDDQKRVKEARDVLTKMIAEITGRDNGPRSAATRIRALEAARDALQSIRDEAVRLDDAGKAASKAAAAASELRQQAPSAPMQTEVSRAA